MDYPALRALAAVAAEGSFEVAAARLGVTPSAVSQRIKGLEERIGSALIVRGQPCVPTETGRHLCRHLEQVLLLEAELHGRHPGLFEDGTTPRRLTIRIVTSADSLDSWFMKALAGYSDASPHLLDLTIEDQDHAVTWLERGEVQAAVTAQTRRVTGCRSVFLGNLRYHATASPAYVARHFANGVDAASLSAAPSLTYNRKDTLQRQWIMLTQKVDIEHPTHWLPSSNGFVNGCLEGVGWGMNPEQMVLKHIREGSLVELVPGAVIDVPLYWQISRRSADFLSDLTTCVVEAAREMLRPR